jgi:Big-like domain-containing protein
MQSSLRHCARSRRRRDRDGIVAAHNIVVAAQRPEGKNMKHRRVSVLAIACGMALSAIACGNSTTAATTVSSLSVAGTAPAVGATSQFKATATMADGSTQDVTTQATWSSTDATVATVSSGGVVTGIAAGSTTVDAVYQTLSAADPIVLVP